MRSSQLELQAFDFPEEPSGATEMAADSAAALKHQVAERLAAHRSRTRKPEAASTTPAGAGNATTKAARSRSARIAAAVAERYAHTPSYRDFLAAEAARAIEQANASAEIAARNAEAVTIAQQQLLAELDLWDLSIADEPAAYTDPAEVTDPQAVTHQIPGTPVPGFLKHLPRTAAAGLTVRLYEDAELRQPHLRSPPPAGQLLGGRSQDCRTAPYDEAGAAMAEEDALDDEIAFRQTPVFDEPASPPIPLPANLIEFPRQLVAPRKSRPRLAEGPLRDEADANPAAAQLRIFEVDASQFSTDPIAVASQAALPEWASIYLDASPCTLFEPTSPPAIHETGLDSALLASAQTERQTQLSSQIKSAPLNLRLMSAAVDGCILAASLLAGICAFSYSVGTLPSAPLAAVALAATLLVLFVLYHLLFFTFSDATPGMRYARIGLCTFADENPTRADMRRRTWAILLAFCPLGLGLLWSLLDEHRLGWHDRLSRMYQRSY